MSDDQAHPLWAVTRTYYTRAETAIDAIEKTRPSEGLHHEVRARVLPVLPQPPVEGRVSGWTFTQPIEVLDLAWDLYMERSLDPTADGAPGFVGLSMEAVPPGDISRLFDIAITAYQRARGKERDE